MRITKRMAILGFNLCSSVFIGLCVYGILVYFQGEARAPRSVAASLAFAASAFASISGICYFGRVWDQRNAEDARDVAKLSATVGKSRRR